MNDLLCTKDVLELLDRIVPRIDAGGATPIDETLHHCEYTLYRERERIHAEFKAVLVQPLLAKHQPCGCVVCTCEDEIKCQGAEQDTVERTKWESSPLQCMNTDHFRDAAQMVHNT